MGEHRLALEFYEQALAICRRALGNEHPDVAGSLNNIGATYSDLGAHREALRYAEQALEIRKKQLGPTHPETLRTLSNVAVALANLGRKLEAHKRIQGVLKTLPKDHVMYSRMLEVGRQVTPPGFRPPSASKPSSGKSPKRKR